MENGQIFRFVHIHFFHQNATRVSKKHLPDKTRITPENPPDKTRVFPKNPPDTTHAI